MKKETQIIPSEFISSKIYYIRKQKVMLDSDLAALYQIETGHLKRAVQRNVKRFPKDFMFELTTKEFETLRCQTGISKSTRGGTRYLPFAFTEHGVAMLSSVLNSPRAIQMNIYIIRAFIKMRELISIDRDLELGIFLLQTEQRRQAEEIDEIIKRLNELTDSPIKTPGQFGFQL